MPNALNKAEIWAISYIYLQEIKWNVQLKVLPIFMAQLLFYLDANSS